MKALKNIILLSSLAVLLSTMACNPEDVQPDLGNDPVAAQIDKLINEGKAWESTPNLSITKDGYDVSDQFQGFSLVFSDGTFEAINALSHVWPDRGNWVINENDLNTIVRGDGVEMQLQMIDNTLTLTFQADAPANGRSQAVSGEYEFVLASQ